MTMPSVTNSATDQSTGPVTSQDISLTISSASDRVLIAFAFIYDNGDGDTVSSITFDPGGGDEDTFTNEAGATANNWTGTVLEHSEAWYLVLDDGVSNGTYTVRIASSSIVGRLGGSIWEVADADTTDPIGATGSATGNSKEISVAVTTTATNSLVAGGGTHQRSGTWTDGADDTRETASESANLLTTWTGHTPAATTTTYTVSATNSGTAQDWAMSGIEILEAAEEAYTGPFPTFRRQ